MIDIATEEINNRDMACVTVGPCYLCVYPTFGRDVVEKGVMDRHCGKDRREVFRLFDLPAETILQGILGPCGPQ